MVEAICGGMGVIGVVLIARPPWIFGSGETVSPGRTLGFVMMAVNTLGAAVIFVIMRYIGSRANALFSVSYFGWITSITMAGVMLVVPTQRAPIASIDGLALIYLAAVRISHQ